MGAWQRRFLSDILQATSLGVHVGIEVGILVSYGGIV
jgi:hypothetical protein